MDSQVIIITLGETPPFEADELTVALVMNFRRLHFTKKPFLTFLLAVVVVVVLKMLHLSSTRRSQVRVRMANSLKEEFPHKDLHRQSLHRQSLHRQSLHRQSLHKPFQINFDMDGQDIIVFLHIQKTGGSIFGKHLVFDLQLERPCICRDPELALRCSCMRPRTNTIWLFSRYSIGWPCGTHAGWTELQPCVPKYVESKEGKNPSRKFYYITIIRDPVTRLVSEYRHHQRGAIWKNTRHFCNGRFATNEELPDPPCFSADEWSKTTLEKFINCPSNLARNRQTRMLADLTLVNCYNVSGMSRAERERIMLASAKQNLQSMAYFALTEYQTESQFLFERTFGLSFARSFEQRSSTNSIDFTEELNNTTLQRIRDVNSLDMELYAYAKDLFLRRVEFFKQRVNNVHVRR